MSSLRPNRRDSSNAPDPYRTFESSRVRLDSDYRDYRDIRDVAEAIEYRKKFEEERQQIDEYRKKKAALLGIDESHVVVDMDIFYKEMKVQRIKRELIQQ